MVQHTGEAAPGTNRVEACSTQNPECLSPLPLLQPCPHKQEGYCALAHALRTSSHHLSPPPEAEACAHQSLRATLLGPQPLRATQSYPVARLPHSCMHPEDRLSLPTAIAANATQAHHLGSRGFPHPACHSMCPCIPLGDLRTSPLSLEPVRKNANQGPGDYLAPSVALGMRGHHRGPHNRPRNLPPAPKHDTQRPGAHPAPSTTTGICAVFLGPGG